MLGWISLLVMVLIVAYCGGAFGHTPKFADDEK